MSENLTPPERKISEEVTHSLEVWLTICGFLGVLEPIAELSKNPAYSDPNPRSC